MPYSKIYFSQRGDKMNNENIKRSIYIYSALEVRSRNSDNYRQKRKPYIYNYPKAVFKIFRMNATKISIAS